ncbi:MAG: phosphatidylserine decarboxylase [Bacteroidales bacterium]|nr:phosphatidylserine decarboxylase [Bacteroidales bacterium]
MVRIHPVGKKFFSIAIILSLLGMVLCYWFLPPVFSIVGMSVFFVLPYLVRFFFRYPERKVLPDVENDDIICPADGKVVVCEQVDCENMPDGKAWQISIFMRLWDVHLNYVPVDGKILSVTHRAGKHLAAFSAKSSLINEHVEYWQDSPYGRILVREVAGLIARRIVPLVRSGQQVRRGDELGFIKFGSRVDIFLPTSAQPLVKKGDRVWGVFSRIATFRTL